MSAAESWRSHMLKEISNMWCIMQSPAKIRQIPTYTEILHAGDVMPHHVLIPTPYEWSSSLGNASS